MKKLFLLIVIIFITTSCFGQNGGKDSVVNVPSKTINQNYNRPNDNINYLLEIEKLKSAQENYDKRVNFVIIILTILLAFGTGFSIAGFIRAEIRETKAFKMTLENAQEAKQSSNDSKKRENTVFEDSHKIMTLVNATLTMANEASKRASKSFETRLNKAIEAYEKNSRIIIEDSGAYEDDKNLTTNKVICSDIHRVGRKIEGIVEHNLIVLEDSNVSLQPFCIFIRGADSYLSEHFGEALDYWSAVSILPNAEVKLRSLSYYWIGYVNNNLGKFTKAIGSFKKAQELATDSRKYEIQRIQLETQFFNNEPINQIIDDLKSLLVLIEKDESGESTHILVSRKTKVLTTLGNVYYQLGNQSNLGKERKQYYNESKKIFADLLNIKEGEDVFAKIYSLDNYKKDKSKWIIFGYTESLYKLASEDNDNEKINLAIELFKKVVYSLAENEFLNREEKRTKVLAKTTQLICSVRANDDEGTISNTKSHVEAALSIDTFLTIYSQIQRRNVNRQIFIEDLDKLLSRRA